MMETHILSSFAAAVFCTIYPYPLDFHMATFHLDEKYFPFHFYFFFFHFSSFSLKPLVCKMNENERVRRRKCVWMVHGMRVKLKKKKIATPQKEEKVVSITVHSGMNHSDNLPFISSISLIFFSHLFFFQLTIRPTTPNSNFFFSQK